MPEKSPEIGLPALSLRPASTAWKTGWCKPKPEPAEYSFHPSIIQSTYYQSFIMTGKISEKLKYDPWEAQQEITDLKNCSTLL